MSNPQISNILNRVTKKNQEFDYLDKWILLMINFGWISYKEYIEMDSEIIDNLLDKIPKIKKMMEKK